MTASPAVRETGAPPRETPRPRPGIAAALRWETRKLRAQARTRAVLLGALVGPVAVVLVIHSQTRPPKDTLFGRFATENGFAMALLLLGFAAQWVLPLLAAIVAGDIFASEDEHGTWKTVLTRSTSRASLFWAKAIVSVGFSLLALVLLAVSTITASLVIVGHEPLTGLSGQSVPAAQAAALVATSWASTALPLVGFTCLALLFSIWSRNAAVGIAAPVALGLVMQLVGAMGGVEAVRPFLLSTPFEAWHGLLAAPRFTGPLLSGAVACAGWSLICLVSGFAILRRRDIIGG
jgi:ABC-2 type transport system permease protein